MAYYSVLEVTPASDIWIDEYLPVANKLVGHYGGEYLARTSEHQRIEGDGVDPTLRIIIQWPSKQAAMNFMRDEEYKPHLLARTQGSESHHFLIKGSA